MAARTRSAPSVLTFRWPSFTIGRTPARPLPTGSLEKGHRLPRGLEEWAALEDDTARSPSVDSRKRELIERFGFYQRIGWARQTPWRAPLQAVARWRCRRDLYAFPVEKTLLEWLRPS
jgi:hypothetical protein